MLKSINNCLNSFFLDPNLSKNHNNILCFGFPDHAFSHQNKSQYPSSFFEFLLFNKLYSRGDKLISIDEYKRHSRPKNNYRGQKTNSIDRIIIKKRWTVKNLLRILVTALDSFKYLKNNLGLKNLIIYSYYFEKYSRAQTLNELLLSLKKNKVHLKKIYAMSLYDIGSIKFDKEITGFTYFNYSQNCFIPPSAEIYSDIFQKKNKVPVNNCLGELTTNILSMYHSNQINLSYQIHYINNILKKIRKNYNLNLKISETNFDLIKSNLGFEYIKKIKLNSNKTNVLFFDLPPESYDQTMRRQFFGDFFATSFFLSEAYDEITELAKSLNFKLFIKPKYSILKNNSNKFYKSIIDSFLDKKIDFEVINPYDKIEIGKLKFDITINLPYTSTYYTFNSITMKKVYYVPKKYYKYFNGISKDFVDYDQLKNILK